ncbi:MAG TPA: STAS domain-containing protein, partial [Verrucomicrobiae bacterium]|nr:STAS domain-containing protein [Verrucomicrobiae bacterium]
MEIISHTREGLLELQLKGRLDANWADHLGNAIESAIRAGQHHIDLDLAEVNYLSSAGIRVLLKYLRQLKTAHGALRVVRTTEPILSVLQLSGIANLLEAGGETAAPAKAQPGTRRWERNGAVFESHDQTNGRGLDGRLHGHPENFASGQLSVAESRRVRFNPEVIGLGLGAFGHDPADCGARFGEFLAAGGAAVAQPTDGSSLPDFQVSEGQLVPEVSLLYGLTANGSFARLLRFEAAQSERRVIALAELVEVALDNVQTPAAGFAILAESASVVGATLRQSPALADGKSPWNFPGVRDWLSFTTERTDERGVALILGLAVREPAGEAAPFFRKIGPGTTAQGHFHAAVFPYRPLPKGNLNLKESV